MRWVARRSGRAGVVPGGGGGGCGGRCKVWQKGGVVW